MTPGITVIVRSLGRPSLEAALDSVAAQRRDDVQVLLVQAGGAEIDLPDLPGLRLQRCGGTVPLHRTDAAQAGWEHVATRWAIFLDDDDEFLPGHLDKLARALQDAPGAVLAHTGVELLFDRGVGQVERAVLDEAFAPWQLLLGNRMPIHAALFDVERGRAAGIAFDRRFDIYEDWDFWLQWQRLGTFAHVPGVSARYHVGAGVSDVHRTAHGAQAYRQVWDKWWPLAPAEWWAQALSAAQAQPDLARAVGDLERQRQDLQDHLTDTRTALAAAQETATHHERRAEQHLAAAQELQRQLVAMSGQAWAAEQQLGQRLTELAQARATLAELRLDRQRTLDELQAVLNSTSWRVTRPLRQALERWREQRARAAALWRSGPARRFWARDGLGYSHWVEHVEAADRAQRAAELAPRLTRPGPRVSVLLPVFNADLGLLDAAIESVRAQIWPHWQLCIADDASTRDGVREHLRQWAARDPRIALVERPENGHIAAATQSALALASGDWVALLDQDDLLAPQALAEVVDAIAHFPDAAVVYSDEDKIDANGRRFEPNFKPAFCLELLRGQNFVNHLVALRRDAVLEAGGFRAGFDGSQDHDLLLRVAQRVRPQQVIHVPRVLYHWRAVPGSTAAEATGKAYALEAAERALREHVQRQAPQARVEVVPGTSGLRVRWPLPEPLPAVARCGPSDEVAPPEGAEFVLLLDGSVQGHGAWLEELMAPMIDPSVAVVGGTVMVDGRRWAGALLAVDAHRVAPAWTVRGVPDRFSRGQLLQAVAAVSPACLLMRRDCWPLWRAAPGATLLERAWRFGQSVRGSGRRVLWTPFAQVEAQAASVGGEVEAVPDAGEDPAWHPQWVFVDGRLRCRDDAPAVSARPGV